MRENELLNEERHARNMSNLGGELKDINILYLKCQETIGKLIYENKITDRVHYREIKKLRYKVEIYEVQIVEFNESNNIN